MSPDKGQRLALYVRVSTDKQATHGHSLDGQRQRLQEYAAARGLQVVETVCDEGLSAKTLDRPGMARVMQLAEARDIDAVVVTKGDRVSRSLRDLLNLGAALEAFGVALVTTDEAIDTSTPIGRAMGQMRGVFSELERSMASARTKEGLAAARAKGVRLGRPPLGWSVVDGRLEPNDRYPVVERAHKLRASGMTLAEVATALNGEGIPTGSGRGGWHPSNVARLLKAPLAAG